MRNYEPGIERRLRAVEITAAARTTQLEVIKSDLKQLENKFKDTKTRIVAIEKSLLRLAIPMKAATWAAAVFAASIIALIWSLILGKAQIIIP
jgi:3-methyladenine DNA glycosylase AlkD